MIELALLLGLGAVGYLLANDIKKEDVAEEFTLQPRPTVVHTDDIIHSQDEKGHSNEVPFFGPRVTQSMYSGATNGIMDSHTGAGTEYFQKSEVRSFFDAKPATGNPFGNANESDFLQSRMVTGQQMKNVFPVDQVHVGPGANDGYTNLPKGGYQQDQLHEYMLPKTTDETRIATKPKLSYEPPVIPGANSITVPGIQAEVKKNRPDRFIITGLEHANTTVGAQTAPTIYSEQPIKNQNRDTTQKEYFGVVGGADGVMESYIRSFMEPFQEFMKLTTEGRPGPAGANGGSGFAIGADMYSAQTKKDETVLSDATRFMSPLVVTNSHAEHMGSYIYKEPLQQDIEMQRNHPEILSAHQSNPYAQKLNAY